MSRVKPGKSLGEQAQHLFAPLSELTVVMLFDY
jgi:hypothetical protein